MSVLTLTVNGEPLSLPAPQTVASLLALRSLAGRRLAVEVDGELVPRSRHDATVLRDGSQIEIVVAVGGG
ncbi:sulfur carrier protein ThiS [Laribacter hongkongensis]|uniref:ThiS n=2 Tax=Laribacter hongkongensis TaxID=168471 RepID=C1DC37_LARHH|nr:sulfur carrier protein ThiS [Laribacter hongkongensis]ACO73454.1 ThiS [Laribacter hongkongensis HLHK9]ASJ23262.1 ThiS domain containing protein [Laribacter hongkongensis]MCG8991511.1 sulfur carrier protein ThiS [Laribacter hongkongensis]MCG8994436.1 sulfur carrier protein ThiS [Laribacter hongkongensis]MCG8996764.1 sulfur carrier protein ThiS [Laribacter hongkongensis]